MPEVVTGFGIFQLVDPGAEVGKNQRGERAGQESAEIENALFLPVHPGSNVPSWMWTTFKRGFSRAISSITCPVLSTERSLTDMTSKFG